MVIAKKENWDGFWGNRPASRKGFLSHSKRRIRKVLDNYAPGRKTALDAGCGTGFFADYLASCGLKTTALDYSAEALKIARENAQNEVIFMQADLLKPGLADILPEKFDLIFSDGLFEHFDPAEQDAIMRNLASVLSPDGVIITFVPNRFSPWELIRPFMMPGIREDPFILSGLKGLNTRNGLTVREEGGVNTVPFRCSPDAVVGKWLGMLLYTVSEK